MSKRICIFGASITEGFYDTEAGGWADRIKQHLKFKEATSVYNLGISGNNTSLVLKRFDIEAKHRRPNQIIFSLGNNDSSYLINEDKNQVPIEEFEKNLSLLIKKSKEYTDNITMVCSPPIDENTCNPWQGNRLYLNKNLKEYNAKIREVCESEKVFVVDLVDEFEKIGTEKLLYDGLHPNSEGHKLMFEIIKDKLDI